MADAGAVRQMRLAVTTAEYDAALTFYRERRYSPASSSRR